jgi:ribose/xylose/arabinose/galactoside ABC-type transport system permease subunit
MQRAVSATYSESNASRARRSPFSSREFLLILINLSIFAILGALRPTAFLSWTNIKAVLSLMSYDLLIAIGMTIVLIVRGIDLSVGSVMALSTVTMALLMRADVPVLPALGAGLIVALSCGWSMACLSQKAGFCRFSSRLA